MVLENISHILNYSSTFNWFTEINKKKKQIQFIRCENRAWMLGSCECLVVLGTLWFSWNIRLEISIQKILSSGLCTCWTLKSCSNATILPSSSRSGSATISILGSERMPLSGDCKSIFFRLILCQSHFLGQFNESNYF